MADRGRPTLYNEATITEILERLSAGESLSSICSDETMPAASTVCLWNAENRNGFSERYARSRLVGVLARLDTAHDRLLESSDKTYEDELGNRRIDTGAVQLARAYADHVRWLACRLIPEYTDIKKVEHSGGMNLNHSGLSPREAAEALIAATGDDGEDEE